MGTNSCQKSHREALKLVSYALSSLSFLVCLACPLQSATGYLLSVINQHSIMRMRTLKARLTAVCHVSSPHDTPVCKKRIRIHSEYDVPTYGTVWAIFFYKSRSRNSLFRVLPHSRQSFFLPLRFAEETRRRFLQGQLTTDANPKPHTYKSGVANDITSRTYCRFHLQIPVSVQLTVSVMELPIHVPRVLR